MLEQLLSSGKQKVRLWLSFFLFSAILDRSGTFFFFIHSVISFLVNKTYVTEKIVSLNVKS